MDSDTNVPIQDERDIVAARQQVRDLAAELGFSRTDQTLLATAVSEITRNILTYAGHGAVVLSIVEQNGRRGIMIVARDEGPGIADIELAMRDGYSTGNSLGVGLPGARRLVDEFHLASTIGVGTTVTLKKWPR